MIAKHVLERIDPTCRHPEIDGWERQVRLHVERYDFAARMLNDGRALDAGCGAGYGTDMLRARGPAIGMDIDVATAAAAAAQHPNSLFLIGDLERPLPLAPGFPAVVCLEAIEHLRGPEFALANLRALIAPSPGRLVISVPLHEQLGDNPYHLRLWDDAASFRAWVEAQGFHYIGRSFEQADNWTGVFSARRDP